MCFRQPPSQSNRTAPARLATADPWHNLASGFMYLVMGRGVLTNASRLAQTLRHCLANRTA